MLGSPNSKPFFISNYRVNSKQLHICRAIPGSFLPLRMNIIMFHNAKIVEPTI